MIVRELQTVVNQFHQLFLRDKTWAELLNNFSSVLRPCNKVIENPVRTYGGVIQKSSRPWPTITESIARIGQLQILCQKISHELNYLCKFQSKFLSSGLSIMNKALLTAVESHYENPDENSYPSEGNPIMFELTNFLDNAGMGDPLAKIYITTKRIPHFSLLCFLCTVVELQKVQYNKSTSGLLCKKVGDGVDAPPFIFGIMTLLKQFHPNQTERYLQFLGQFVRSYFGPSFSWNSKNIESHPEVISTCAFLEDLVFLSKIDRKIVENCIPTFILDEFRKNIV